MKAEDAKRLRELIADVNNASDGDYLDRLTRGYRIAYACAEFIRESGPSLLALYDAVMGDDYVLMPMGLDSRIEDAYDDVAESVGDSLLLATGYEAMVAEAKRLFRAGDKDFCGRLVPDCGSGE